MAVDMSPCCIYLIESLIKERKYLYKCLFQCSSIPHMAVHAFGQEEKCSPKDSLNLCLIHIYVSISPVTAVGQTYKLRACIVFLGVFFSTMGEKNNLNIFKERHTHPAFTSAQLTNTPCERYTASFSVCSAFPSSGHAPLLSPCLPHF